MGSLRRWLQSRNEENIMGKTVAHVQKVLECVTEFERAFSFFNVEKDHALALQVLQRVDLLESEADVIRRDLQKLIATSDMDPSTREDLATIVRRIDRIANSANGAARHLMGIPEHYLRSLGEETLKEMHEIVSISVSATKILFTLMKEFATMENPRVFQITEQIQKLEHKCDHLHSSIYTRLNAMPSVSFNPFAAIEMSHFIDNLEEISDKVEDVADYIELLKTVLR